MKRFLLALAPLLISTAARADGAIAYSPSTGEIGWSHGYDSAWQAKAAAESSCGVCDCTVRVHESNEYAVIAVGEHGHTAVAWNPNLWKAERDAIATCSTVDTNCDWRRWVRG